MCPFYFPLATYSYPNRFSTHEKMVNLLNISYLPYTVLSPLASILIQASKTLGVRVQSLCHFTEKKIKRGVQRG